MVSRLIAVACAAALLTACAAKVEPEAEAKAEPVAAQEPAQPVTPQLNLAFAGGGWDGVTVPSGQQCRLDGGDGATPPIRVAGLPAGTSEVVVSYNDLDFEPLSTDGGHGVIGYVARPGEMVLQPVRGMSSRLPRGVRVVSPARSTGRYASPGYLPPCSGGAGHRYVAEVEARDASGAVLAEGVIPLGAY